MERSPLKLDESSFVAEEEESSNRKYSDAVKHSLPSRNHKNQTKKLQRREEIRNQRQVHGSHETSAQDQESVPKSEEDEGFIRVNRRAKRKNAGVLGQRKTNIETNFKCAKKYVDLYIGQCDLHVTCSDIKIYINEELNIDDFKIIELNCRNPENKSFKISVTFEDRIKLLSGDSWPEGIICRKFFNNNNNAGNRNL